MKTFGDKGYMSGLYMKTIGDKGYMSGHSFLFKCYN